MRKFGHCDSEVWEICGSKHKKIVLCYFCSTIIFNLVLNNTNLQKKMIWMFLVMRAILINYWPLGLQIRIRHIIYYYEDVKTYLASKGRITPTTIIIAHTNSCIARSPLLFTTRKELLPEIALKLLYIDVLIA